MNKEQAGEDKVQPFGQAVLRHSPFFSFCVSFERPIEEVKGPHLRNRNQFDYELLALFFGEDMALAAVEN